MITYSVLAAGPTWLTTVSAVPVDPVAVRWEPEPIAAPAARVIYGSHNHRRPLMARSLVGERVAVSFVLMWDGSQEN